MRAVEWLYQEITKKSVNEPSHNVLKILEQAKIMEKQQIIDAYIDGVTGDSNTSNADLYAERYYNETFKTK